MSNWWKKNKPLIIIMIIIGLILALFVVPAFIRAGFEKTLETGMYFGKGVLDIVPETFSDVFRKFEYYIWKVWSKLLRRNESDRSYLVINYNYSYHKIFR